MTTNARYHSRLFVRVGHENTYASSGNSHFLLYHVRPTKILNRANKNWAHLKKVSLKIKIKKESLIQVGSVV